MNAQIEFKGVGLAKVPIFARARESANSIVAAAATLPVPNAGAFALS
jgi:hypothetical protein